MVSEYEHINNILIQYYRRLQKLEEQKARFGINTRTEILIEIEDIELDIQKTKAMWADVLKKDNENLKIHISELIKNEDLLRQEIEILRKQLEELKRENSKLKEGKGFKSFGVYDYLSEQNSDLDEEIVKINLSLQERFRDFLIKRIASKQGNQEALSFSTLDAMPISELLDVQQHFYPLPEGYELEAQMICLALEHDSISLSVNAPEWERSKVLKTIESVEQDLNTLEGLETEKINSSQPETKGSEKDKFKANLNFAKLRQEIIDSFNIEELRDLCFDLSIDSEKFPSAKDGFVREIISYCNRHGRITDLVSYCEEKRPHMSW